MTPDPVELDAYLSAAFGRQDGETYAIRWPFLDADGGVTLLMLDRIAWIPAQHLGHPPARGRWLCVACDVEGRGPPPAQCPECRDKAWYCDRRVGWGSPADEGVLGAFPWCSL